MATFHQQGQQVRYQYNADIMNFGNVQTRSDLAAELKKLVDEISRATTQGALDRETSLKAETALKKAIIHVEKPQGDRSTILACLDTARTVLQVVPLASGFVTGLSQAIQLVGRLFS